jgi:hypothetical protein
MIRPLFPWAIGIIILAGLFSLFLIIASVRALNRYNRWGSGWDLAEGVIYYLGSFAMFFMMVWTFIEGR